MPRDPAAPKSRRHVTTACIPCRKSKVKCDGVTPLCGPCRQSNRQCRYQTGEDKRKVSPRAAVDLLLARVDELTRFIRDNHLVPPAASEETVSVLSKLGHNLDVDGHEQNGRLSPNSFDNAPLKDSSYSSHQKQSAVAQMIALPNAESRHSDVATGTEVQQEYSFVQTLDWDWSQDLPGCDLDVTNFWDFELNQGLLSNPDGAQPIFDASMLPDPSDHQISDSSDEEDMEALVDQISYRVGSLKIEPDGQTRYYGPTSNYSMKDVSAPEGQVTINRTVRRDGQAALNSLGLGRQVPPEIEKHLIELYFCWQEPSINGIDRSLYESAQTAWIEKEEDTPHYSESLKNAICALGANFEIHYHPSFVTFPRCLPDFFGDRAKALLDIEQDNPTVATVQALVLLSVHEIGCRRDARGFLLSGSALRLAFHLALHIDMAPFVEKGLMKKEEAEIRRKVFWSAYVADHSWGFSLGRPFRTNMEDVTAAKPGESELPKTVAFWTPYASQTKRADVELPDTRDQVSQRHIALCEIMAPLGNVLYGNAKIPHETLQELNTTTVGELWTWFQDLPTPLQIDLDNPDKSYLPHVLLLQMHYYQNMIYAHRPWMSRTLTQPSPQQGPGRNHARMVCVESAACIGKILVIFERQYSFNRMHLHAVSITCSAAMLLILACVTRYPGLPKADIDNHLGSCFRALEAFSPFWNTAKRAREFLTALQRKWVKKERQQERKRMREEEAREDVRAKRPGGVDENLEWPAAATEAGGY